VLVQIRQLLDAHPKVDPTSSRARFMRFTAASLDLEIFAYVLETDHAAFLATQEELLLGIMDIIGPIAAPGVDLLRALDLAKDRGLATR
jgi:MscS family membrane protein